MDIQQVAQNFQRKYNSKPQAMQILQSPSASKQSAGSPCPDCGGQKYLRYDVPIGHPQFGRLAPCQTCNSEAVTYNSGLNPFERKIGLDELETTGRPGAHAMVKACATFLEAKTGMLTIHGGYGNGKSTALKGLVNACIREGVEARYITMNEVMVYAREAFDSQKSGDSDYGRIARLASTRVLVIDELDKARLTDYAREVQTHLFDIRYREAHRLGTVVAWNGEFKDIPLPWVLSRLSEYPVIHNKDADMRELLGG